jgi:hypothetical protein
MLHILLFWQESALPDYGEHSRLSHYHNPQYMSHPEFLERLFEGKKGEERDKKDPLNYTRMRYKFIKRQEVRIIDVVSVSHTSNR